MKSLIKWSAFIWLTLLVSAVFGWGYYQRVSTEEKSVFDTKVTELNEKHQELQMSTKLASVDNEASLDILQLQLQLNAEQQVYNTELQKRIVTLQRQLRSQSGKKSF